MLAINVSQRNDKVDIRAEGNGIEILSELFVTVATILTMICGGDAKKAQRLFTSVTPTIRLAIDNVTHDGKRSGVPMVDIEELLRKHEQ